MAKNTQTDINLLSGVRGTEPAQDLARILEAMTALPSVSGQEGALADAVQRALSSRADLLVRRLGDTVVASTRLGRPHRIVLAGHLDTVPVDGNMPPRWLEPGDPDIRADLSAAHPGIPGALRQGHRRYEGFGCRLSPPGAHPSGAGL